MPRVFPGSAVRAYLDELDLPRHDIHFDLGRVRRLAIEAIEAMSDEELAEVADAPVGLVPVLRGARTLIEAREVARQILAPAPVVARRAGTADDRAVRGAERGSPRVGGRFSGEIDRP